MVVQIVAAIVLGPGVLGKAFPDYFHFVFDPSVVQSLNGRAWWAAMVFVWIAGIELDLRRTWAHRGASAITTGFALGAPLLLGSVVAFLMLGWPGWIGAKAQQWQFVLGVGMACAVTALPVLILLMHKLEILRHPIGQRILRYASHDHLRQRVARQAAHHERDFHGPVADGARKHDADDAVGRAQAGADEGKRVGLALVGSPPQQATRLRRGCGRMDVLLKAGHPTCRVVDLPSPKPGRSCCRAPRARRVDRRSGARAQAPIMLRSPPRNCHDRPQDPLR